MDKSSKAGTTRLAIREAKSTRTSRFITRMGRLKGPIAAVAAFGGLIGGMAGYWNGWRALNSSIAETSVNPVRQTGSIAPFSAADRRMTFAVLPFQAPTGDVDGARMAMAAFEVAQSEQESNVLWGRVVPRALVEQQGARPQTLSQLGQALDVHFIYRGNVIRSNKRPALELAVIDATTERVLDQHTINADSAPGRPQFADEAVRDATYSLTYAALKQEVARARDKADAQQDVRDLTFRAYVDWRSDDGANHAASYAAAMKDLRRAQALAPDDLLTLQVIAQLNLCECIKAWAADNRPMVEIGVAALDRALALRPDWPTMQELRSYQYFKHQQYQEALLVNDALLAKEPNDPGALSARLDILLALGKPKEALALVPAARKAEDSAHVGAIAATVYFANGDDAQAARLARKVLVQLTRAQRADEGLGYVALVLTAAESRADHLNEARRVFKEFQDTVPKTQTVGQIKVWLGPSRGAIVNEAFWLALQRAGADG